MFGETSNEWFALTKVITVGKNTNAEGLAMYKLLLSWRYLKSRYIALASIVSVTLGVATLIVVNSVMAGFSGCNHSVRGGYRWPSCEQPPKHPEIPL